MSEDYAAAITAQSVARTCVALGFREAQEECIDVLTEVVHNYIQMIAENAHEQAESTGRVQPGTQDVLAVLGTPRFESTTWKSLQDFGLKDGSWKQPFPHDVPDFPAPQRSKRDRCDFDEPSLEHGPEVPVHLPPYPPLRTHKRSVVNKKKNISNEKEQRSRRIAAIKTVQDSLTKIEEAGDMN